MFPVAVTNELLPENKQSDEKMGINGQNPTRVISKEPQKFALTGNIKHQETSQ